MDNSLIIQGLWNIVLILDIAGELFHFFLGIVLLLLVIKQCGQLYFLYCYKFKISGFLLLEDGLDLLSIINFLVNYDPLDNLPLWTFANHLVRETDCGFALFAIEKAENFYLIGIFWCFNDLFPRSFINLTFDQLKLDFFLLFVCTYALILGVRLILLKWGKAIWTGLKFLTIIRIGWKRVIRYWILSQVFLELAIGNAIYDGCLGVGSICWGVADLLFALTLMLRWI